VQMLLGAGELYHVASGAGGLRRRSE